MLTGVWRLTTALSSVLVASSEQLIADDDADTKYTSSYFHLNNVISD